MRKLLAVIGFLVLLIGCGGDDAGSGGNSGGVTIIGGESLTFGIPCNSSLTGFARNPVERQCELECQERR